MPRITSFSRGLGGIPDPGDRFGGLPAPTSPAAAAAAAARGVRGHERGADLKGREKNHGPAEVLRELERSGVRVPRPAGG